MEARERRRQDIICSRQSHSPTHSSFFPTSLNCSSSSTLVLVCPSLSLPSTTSLHPYNLLVSQSINHFPFILCGQSTLGFSFSLVYFHSLSKSVSQFTFLSFHVTIPLSHSLSKVNHSFSQSLSFSFHAAVQPRDVPLLSLSPTHPTPQRRITHRLLH